MFKKFILLNILLVFFFTSGQAMKYDSIIMIVDDGKSFNFDSMAPVLGTYAAILKAPDGTNTDFYEFTVNVAASNQLNQTEIQQNVQLLTISDLLKQASCDRHYFLSENRNFIIKRQTNGTTEYLAAFYLSTYRNLVKTKL